MRRSTLLFHLTQRLLYTKWRDPGEEPKLHLFGQLKRITKQWLDTCLVCKGGTYPAQLMYQELADMACERITAAITRAELDRAKRPIKAVLDPYNPTGSTATSTSTPPRPTRWETDARRCHVNWVILDSDWEAEFCRVAEAHPRVAPTSRTTTSGSRCPTATAPRCAATSPTSSSWSTTAAATTTRCTWSSRSRATAARTPRRRRPPWRPTGCRREQPRHYGRWAFAEFTRVAYERRNRDLDPQLVWRGKDEQDWSDLVVHAPPLYIQEKGPPQGADRRPAEAHPGATEAGEPEQIDLFADFNGLPRTTAPRPSSTSTTPTGPTA
jgi:type III restriction enzyme